MVAYKQACLTTATERLIVHGCNAQGKMKSGVAKAIRSKWIQTYNAYMEAYMQGQRSNPLQPVRPLPLGSYSFAIVGPRQTVINAITQEHYGYNGAKYVSYDAVDKVTKAIARDFCGCESIAMPKIGSGLGGGDWSIIESIIKANLAGTFDVTVYEGP